MTNQRKCLNCGRLYVKNKTPGRIAPWNTSKFCSPKCQASFKSKTVLGQERKAFTTLVDELDDGKVPMVKLLSDKIKSGEVRVGTRLPIKVGVRTAGHSVAFRSPGHEGQFLAGNYEIGGKTMYFRSKWEANVALYLEFLKKNHDIVEWEYEKEFYEFGDIRHGTTRYLPDFHITNLDGSIEIWEVKGYMDARSKTKLKRMKKYYPHIKLILVDKDFYQDLKRKVGKMLNFY